MRTKVAALLVLVDVVPEVGKLEELARGEAVEGGERKGALEEPEPVLAIHVPASRVHRKRRSIKSALSS